MRTRTASILLGLLVLGCCAMASAQQLMPADLIEKYKSVLPATDEPLAREVFDSEDTIWYSHQYLHPRTQAHRFPNERFGGQRGVMQGVHSAYSNPGPNNQSQANREYPWDLTLGGGSHDADNVKTVKAFRLPRDADGRILPAVVFGSRPMRVCFPRGTIFAEVAWLVDTDGIWWPCEIRIRAREETDWDTRRLLPRPLEDKASFVEAVAETHPQIAAMIKAGKGERMRIRAAHPRPIIDDVMTVQDLPDFPAELTKRILSEPFVDTSGTIKWHDDIDFVTTSAAFHIRPRGDTTANHGFGNRQECAQCHNTVGRHARAFDMSRDWYLTVRGLGDGIISWHPWADNMPSQMGDPNNLRRSWVQAGLVAKFDPKAHTPPNYRQSEFLREEIRRGVN